MISLALVALTACAPTAPLARDAAPAPATVAADDNLNAVLWVQTAQEYRALTQQTWKLATANLDRALADKQWTALLPGEGAELQTPDLPPAVIVDVDETVLDNSPYQARLILDGVPFSDAGWAGWVAERKAKPVPGALEFARAAAAKGVTMVYISNRTAEMKDDTLANLRAVGFPVADDSVYLGLGMEVPGCTAHGSEKGCRRIATARKYRVLMQVGDQITDFAQISANTRAQRDALLDNHGHWIGERWYMLPGPTYGGYEPAAVGNTWTLPAEQRRAAKRAALEPAR